MGNCYYEIKDLEKELESYQMAYDRYVREQRKLQYAMKVTKMSETELTGLIDLQLRKSLVLNNICAVRKELNIKRHEYDLYKKEHSREVLRLDASDIYAMISKNGSIRGTIL